jgi:hypothetical protein
MVRMHFSISSSLVNGPVIGSYHQDKIYSILIGRVKFEAPFSHAAEMKFIIRQPHFVGINSFTEPHTLTILHSLICISVVISYWMKYSWILRIILREF